MGNKERMAIPPQHANDRNAADTRAKARDQCV